MKGTSDWTGESVYEGNGGRSEIAEVFWEADRVDMIAKDAIG